MRIAALALTAAGLIAATSSVAVAGEAATDLDFLKANRCRGLVDSGKFQPVDVKALDSYIDEAAQSRGGYLLERARNERAKAKRDARYKDRHERLSGELTGSCMVYMGGSSTTATAQSKAPVPQP